MYRQIDRPKEAVIQRYRQRQTETRETYVQRDSRDRLRQGGTDRQRQRQGSRDTARQRRAERECGRGIERPWQI